MYGTTGAACLCRLLILTTPLLLSACDKRDYRPSPISRGLEILAGPTDPTPGETIQFRAVYTESGIGRDVTPNAQWSSNNPAVLSVAAGLATAHAVGTATLTVQYEGLQRFRTVPVVGTAGWDGAYTLAVGGTNCTDAMPPALRQRTYAATVVQKGTSLDVTIFNGRFVGQIIGNSVRFDLLDYSYYGYHGPSLWEVLPDGNMLVVSGFVTAASSASGFSGTLVAGLMTLYPPGGARSFFPLDKGNAIATCDSQSFNLTR